MFRAVFLPIIRSYRLYIRHWHVLYRFEDSHAAVRPDDGQRNCPKHVKYQNKIWKFSPSVGFYCKILST